MCDNLDWICKFNIYTICVNFQLVNVGWLMYRNIHLHHTVAIVVLSLRLITILGLCTQLYEHVIEWNLKFIDFILCKPSNR